MPALVTGTRSSRGTARALSRVPSIVSAAPAPYPCQASVHRRAPPAGDEGGELIAGALLIDLDAPRESAQAQARDSQAAAAQVTESMTHNLSARDASLVR